MNETVAVVGAGIAGRYDFITLAELATSTPTRRVETGWWAA